MLKWLNERDLHDSVIEFLQEIKLLTGAMLHEGEDLLRQVTILKIFIASSPGFRNLTTNEIRHAFYLNNQGEYDEVYRHFNKEINAEFVGDVLRSYIKYKEKLYHRHGREIKEAIGPSKPKTTPALPPEQEYQKMIQADYNHFLAGNYQFIFVSFSTYKLLRQYGAMPVYSRAHWLSLIGRAMQERIKYGKSSLLRKTGWERENILEVNKIYETYEKEGWVPGSEFKMIIHTLQKQQYFRFFKTMQYFKIKDIFKEVKIDKLCTTTGNQQIQ